jgi:hypothetical protein
MFNVPLSTYPISKIILNFCATNFPKKLVGGGQGSKQNWIPTIAVPYWVRRIKCNRLHPLFSIIPTHRKNIEKQKPGSRVIGMPSKIFFTSIRLHRSKNPTF